MTRFSGIAREKKSQIHTNLHNFLTISHLKSNVSKKIPPNILILRELRGGIHSCRAAPDSGESGLRGIPMFINKCLRFLSTTRSSPSRNARIKFCEGTIQSFIWPTRRPNSLIHSCEKSVMKLSTHAKACFNNYSEK